jgi:mono/diheme cytochrome c family protein
MCPGKAFQPIRLSYLSAFVIIAFAACNRQAADGSEDGRKIFATVCASCHGEQGKPPASLAATLGVRDLISADFRARASTQLVEAQVNNGSVNHIMPAYKGVLTSAQVAAVAAFVVNGLPAEP